MSASSSTPSGSGGYLPEDATDRLSWVTLTEADLAVREGILEAGVYPREVFRQRVVGHLIDKHTREMEENGVDLPERPQVVITGGGPGAGKTTVLNYLNDIDEGLRLGTIVIQADEMKHYIPEYRTMLAQGNDHAAGVTHGESRIMAQMAIDKAIEKRLDVAHESSLWDTDHAGKVLEPFKKAGYQTRIISIVIDPEEACRRVLYRGLKTGRMIPLEDVVRAHQNHMRHVGEIVELSDHAQVFTTGAGGASEIKRENLSAFVQPWLAPEPRDVANRAMDGFGVFLVSKLREKDITFQEVRDGIKKLKITKEDFRKDFHRSVKAEFSILERRRLVGGNPDAKRERKPRAFVVGRGRPRPSVETLSVLGPTDRSVV